MPSLPSPATSIDDSYNGMILLMKKQDWEQDIRNRQRNIVFPDTVLNEGRFYRNIFSRDAEFTSGQRISLVFFGLFIMFFGSFALASAIAGLLASKDGTRIFDLAPTAFMLGAVILGIALLVRGLFPPKPTRLTRLQRYRRPPFR